MTTRRIHLHGALRELHDGVFELDARTVAEAINGFCKLLKVPVDPVRGRRLIKVLGFDRAESLFEETPVVDLHLFPAFTGGKGLVQVIIGTVLIAAAFIPGLGTIAGVALSSMLFGFGASMLLGGLMELMAPTPKQRQSRYLGAPGNTTANGTPIPLLFGTCLAYGQYLSYDIQSSVIDNQAAFNADGSTSVTTSTNGDVTSVVLSP